jgi:hypothetical protein
MKLVRKVDTPHNVFSLPHSSAHRNLMKVEGNLWSLSSVRKISIVGNKIVLRHNQRTLTFSGSFNTSAALSMANRQPALQREYAQGINQQYLGPETGTLFSYGPAISSLEYDGSNYAYDKNGQLVNKGSGKGLAAKAYDNSILRTGMLVSNDFLLKTSYQPMTGTTWSLELKAGQENNKSIIRQNDNLRQKWGVSIQNKDMYGRKRLTLSYDNVSDRFDYGNRNGFLNRVYQSALLTPTTFQNEQGTMIGNTQRSYSSGADNPLFLLQDHDNSYGRRIHNASIIFDDKKNRFSYTLTPSFQSEKVNTVEAYAAGTTGFLNGSITRREQKNNRFQTKGRVNYHLPQIDELNLQADLTVIYNYSNTATDIRYQAPLPEYQYRRSTHEPVLHYSGEFYFYNWSIMFDMSNQAYISNTTNNKSYWLPGAGLTIIKEIYKGGRIFKITFTSKYNQYNSELPIQQSLAAINLLNYTTATLPGFLPVTEVKSYSPIQPVNHKEWSGELKLSYGRFLATGTYYNHHTSHDVLPVINGNNIELKNMANHVNQGMEIQISQNDIKAFNGKGKFSNKLSFSTNRTHIIAVDEGYNYTPTAGFSDVHTALVAGGPANVIVGSAYLRDASHQIVKGADGRPLVDPSLQVIGNPNPDFWLGLSNYLSYGSFTLNTIWQWKKGGKKWNGTAAMLDYYGRSANSALQRKTDGTPPMPVAENYIHRADYIRINNLSLTMERKFKGYVNQLKVTAFARNILLWTPYKGVDPDQSLMGQNNATGLDYFNLPATTTAGIEVSILF